VTDIEPEPAASPGTPTPSGPPAPDPGGRPRGRPLIERIGLALIAVVFGALFAFVGIAAFLGGQPFLGVMGLIGCLMVLWVGGLTLFRG
jgi:hypothetical protein